MRARLTQIVQRLLGMLARATIRKYNPGIIGITGNVGKTSTRTAIYHILSPHRRVRVAKKNFNNELGLALTILGDWSEIRGITFWPRVILASLFRLLVRSHRYPELLILEYGADRPGDIRYLTEIAKPTLACITAIGEIPAHVEFFTGPDAVAREKARLIEALPASGFAVLNADDEAVMNVRERTRAHVTTFGFADSAHLRISSFEHRRENGAPAGISFKLEHEGRIVPVKITGAVGLPQAYVAAAAASMGLVFGINLVAIAETLATYVPPAGRLRRIPGIKGTTIIDDTYNASPLSTRRALETAKELAGDNRLIAVLGDMLEIGKYAIEAHEAIGAYAAEVADRIVAVGPHAMFIVEGAKKSGFPETDIAHFRTTDEAKTFVQGLIEEGDLILVKGSQGIRMEKIVEEIMENPQDAAEVLVRQSAWWKRR